MCGIAGVLNLNAEPVARETVKRMTDAVAHRRLSIIDLSPAGRQPMATGDGRYVVTYNGELYNFRELRAELEALGRRFRSRSDTEVLVEAWGEWGVEALDRFNGMFAFAVW